jgi:hypothetical protein
LIHRSSSRWKGTKTLCKIRFVGTFQHTVSHCSKTGERESDSSHEGIVPLLFARDSAPGAVAAAVLLLPLPALRAAACLLAAVAAAVLLLPVPALPGAACLVAAVAAAFAAAASSQGHHTRSVTFTNHGNSNHWQLGHRSSSTRKDALGYHATVD